MAAKTDVWMPLYVADYLADTSRLTTLQHGAYMLLIMDYWRNGSLPDDDFVLAQVTRMQGDAWSTARSVLVRFFSIENGVWVHKRIEEEIKKARVNSQKAHDRAVKAAAARWEKENALSNASSIASALLEECPSPSPSPSPSPIPTSTPSSSQGKSKDLPPPAASAKKNALQTLIELGVDENAARDWLTVRKAKRAPLTQAALDELSREAGKAGISINEAVTICARKTWQGFNSTWNWKDAQPAQQQFMTASQRRMAVTDKAIDEWLNEDAPKESTIEGEFKHV